MRVLLLGASGQVGSELAPLLAREHELVAPSRTDLDLSEPGAARSFVERALPGLVINAAAMTDVDGAEREPELAARINAAAVREIAEACSTARAALLQLSTDFVFSGELERPYVETDEPGPINAYGLSKLEGERAAREGCDAAIVIRTSWVQSLRRPCFVTRTIERALTSDVLSAAVDQTGSPTSAGDLASAICEVVSAAGASMEGFRRLAGVYHAAGHGVATRMELTEMLLRRHPDREAFRAREVVGRPASSFPVRAARPLRTPLDCAALERAFGVRLPDWEDGITRLLATATARPEAAP